MGGTVGSTVGLAIDWVSGSMTACVGDQLECNP